MARYKPFHPTQQELQKQAQAARDSLSPKNNSTQGPSEGSTLNMNNLNDPTFRLESNILHQYASHNYLFTLSALNRDDLDFPERITTLPAHDIIAQSAGIGKGSTFSDSNTQFANAKSKYNKANDKTSTGRTLSTASEEAISNLKNKLAGADTVLRQNKDIFFETVEIESKPRANAERKLMNFTRIKFSLSEPLGITLFEKLRAAAGNCGYIDHTEAPFLLTIEFKGYDSNGTMLPGPPKRYLPIRITEANMRLDAGGSTYEVSASPWTEFAMVNTFLYTQSTGEARAVGNNLDAILRSLSDALNNNQKVQRDNKYRSEADEYRITYDPLITENVDVGPLDINNSKIRGSSARNSFKSVNYREGDSIAMILERIILQIPKYKDIKKIQETYWNKVSAVTLYDNAYEQLPSEYVPWFKIVTNVHIEPDYDDYLKTHKKIIHFHIKPFYIHIANFARAGLPGNPSWGNWVRKRYDYIYTGQNHDITNLEINYNRAFYQAKLVNSTTVENVASDFAKSLGRKILSFVGIDTYPEINLPLKQYPMRQRSSNSGSNEQEDQAQIQEFYDYLTNPLGDMVNVDMEILGDPAFVGHDFAIPMTKPLDTGKFSEKVAGVKGSFYDPDLGAFNFDSAEVVIQLNFRFPTDFNENTGLYDFSSESTPIFSGLYRINSVLSVFDKGTFKQNLQMSRFNNQDPAQSTTKGTTTTTGVSLGDVIELDDNDVYYP